MSPTTSKLKNQRRREILRATAHRQLRVENLQQRRLLAVLAADGFASGNFSGGSEQWATGSWAVSGDATVRSDTSPASGSQHARLRRSTGDLQRTVDVTDLTDVRLQFSAKLISFEGSDRADVKVSGDGTNWITIQSFVNGDDDGQYHTYDLAVPDVGNTLHVRFDAGMSGSADYWFIDDVQVIGTPVPSAPLEIAISDTTAIEGGAAWAFAESYETVEQLPTYQTWDLARSPAGDFYATTAISNGSSGIIRIDGQTGTVDSEFVPLGTAGLGSSREIAIQNDWIYVGNKSTNEVLRFDLATGTPDSAGPFISGDANGFVNPRGITFDPAGNLFLISKGTNEILKFDAQGTFLEIFASDVTSAATPNDLALDGAGNIYVTGDAKVLKYAGDGTFLGVFADAGSSNTTSIEFGPDGDLYVGAGVDNRLLRFDGQTGALKENFADDTFGEKQGLAFDDAGSLFVANNAGNTTRARVLRYASSSAATFSVTLSTPSATPISVNFATVNSSAFSGSDYHAASGTIVFEPGVTTRTIVIPSIDDADVESEETFNVLLSNPVGGVLLDGSGTGTIVDDDAVPSISYPNFSDPSGLNLVGRAAIADGNILRIVPDENGGPGAAWYVADKQFVSVAWETTFVFNLNQNSGAIDGSDGFTFAIQNHDPNYVSGGGGALGYTSLLNSLVVEFDTFQNSENADPGPSHISIHTNGTAANGPNETFSIASANTPTIIDDAANHSVKITYTPGTLTVFLDDLATPFLTASVDLAQLLDLDLGRAWVGFTGATGGGLQNHDILNWDFRVFANTTTAIAVANTEVIEGDSGLTDLVFTVSRLGDTSGTSIVDWATANGTATAGSDYVSDAGQITFDPGDTQKTITISVNPDTAEETHETVFLNLSNAIGAALVDNLAVGTILNDDASVSINDTAAVEGDESPIFIDQFISTAGDGLFGPNAMTIGPDGNFYVAGQNSSNVLRYDAATGNLIDVFIPSGSGVDNPRGLAFDADGNLYVPSQATDAVLRFQGPFGANPGQLIDTFVSPGDGGLNGPFHAVFGPDGSLYVSSAASDSVLRYQGPSGSNPGQFIDAFVATASGGLDGPTDLLFAADGTLYVGSLSTDSVLRYQGPAGANPGQFIDAFIATGSGGLDGPASLALDGDGNLYVSSYLSNSVLRYEGPSGSNPGQFMDAFVPSGGGGLANPRAVRFGADGNLYVVSKTNNEVLRYGAASQAVFTVSLSSPVGTAVTVDYATLDVTAVAGSDYTDIQGSLTFPPGTTELTILVPTIDDAEEESTETFSVSLSNPIGVVISTPTPAVGFIFDDDTSNQPPLVDAGDDQTLIDADGNGSEAVTLSGFAFDLDGSIAYAEWTLDGNVLGTTPIVNTTLPVGVHTITLTATDNQGASSSDTVMVTVNPAPTEVVLFEDSFEVGSNDWNGKWIEDSQNDFFRSTQRSTHGSRSAEVDGWAYNATLTMAAPIDLSGHTSNTLTFDWLIENGFDNGEFLSLDISTNGGSSWSYDVRRLSGNVDAENTWHSESVDLSSFASSNLLIRFRSYVSSSSEDANIDNVKIVGYIAGGGANPITALLDGFSGESSDDLVIAPVLRSEPFPATHPLDVNQDGYTTPLDALLVVNWLNQHSQVSAPAHLDTNQDGQVTPIDMLLIVNELNHLAAGARESASLAPVIHAGSVDDFFGAMEDEEEDVLGANLLSPI